MSTQLHTLAFTLDAVDFAIAEIDGYKVEVSGLGSVYIAKINGDESQFDNVYILLDEVEKTIKKLIPAYTVKSRVWSEGTED